MEEKIIKRFSDEDLALEGCVVYVHKRPDTGDIFYVGCTKNPKERPYRTNKGYNKAWMNMYNTYGMGVEIMGTGTYRDMLELEEFMIDEIGLDNLTNVVRGGLDGYRGYKHTDETRAKMRIAAKSKVITDEHRRNISKGNRVKVEQLNEDGTVVKLWDSIAEAAESVDAKATHITRVCKGKRKHTRGFKWRYYEVH